ncbi:MAG: VOC family protein [Spirochaetota bacterium]
MKFKSLIPNLMVENVKNAIDFYKKTLDFVVLSTNPEDSNEYEWAMIKRDDVIIMLQEKKSLSGEIPYFENMSIGASLTFYINVDNISEVYSSVKSKVDIVQDLHNTFYGAEEFAFKDNSGYVIAIGEQKGS